MAEDGLRIVELRSENVKRIKAVRVAPGGEPGTVVIAGANGAGKTSVLDAIMFALAGRRSEKETPQPIRTGTDRAYVKLDLGDYTVTRTWHGENSELHVTAKDGAVYGSPQKFLDKRLGDLTFDPLAFARDAARDQRDQLLGMIELDFDPEELAARRLGLYEQRTEAGRDLKAAEGALATMPVPDPQLPTQTVNVGVLASRIEEATATTAAYERAEAKVANLERNVERCRAMLAEAEAELSDARVDLGMAPAPMSHEAIEQLRQQMATADELNEAIRARGRREEQIANAEALRTKVARFTESIETLDAGKAASLAAATMPIAGLGFDDDGVTYGGQPFSQCSAAEQLRVSVAIGMASHPEIRVMRITDGSLLDSTSMAVIEDLALANGYQVWIERVDESGDVGVVIEDGEVRGAEPWPPEQPDTEVEQAETCQAVDIGDGLNGERAGAIRGCTRPPHADSESHSWGDWTYATTADNPHLAQP
jgi:hypothetical protein